ncbi:UNKNOWN [Stylonychia lemnae]|uniref:Uncharacterized protein n=1 Tax=Stylonychia lemnae TaxID=5949 RepID=A0A077ZYW1_STYLE|nr:UNKNOWN [Stylonychia lemnae]|eukprot:CDW75146.1 UNKNOWN [Stylonychia lemnae]
MSSASQKSRRMTKQARQTAKIHVFVVNKMKKDPSDSTQQDKYGWISADEKQKLSAYLEGLPQLHNEKTLQLLYLNFDGYEDELKQVMPFWKNAIEGLYKNVFMKIDLTQQLIKNAFNIYDRSPAGLKNIIEDLVKQGVLISKRDFMKQMKDGNWFRVMKRYMSLENLGCAISKLKEEDSYISLQYMRFVCDELINWTKEHHQGVLTYNQLRQQIEKTFFQSHDNFHIIKDYLKQLDYYDVHVIQPENLKLVKVSKEGHFNKFDINFYRLKIVIRRFRELLQEQKSIKEKIQLYLENDKQVINDKTGQLESVPLSSDEQSFLIDKLGILDKVIAKANHFKGQYIEPNLNRVIELQQMKNELSANMQAQLILKSINDDLPKFEEILCILDQYDRQYDFQEISILNRYGLYLTNQERLQAIDYYTNMIINSKQEFTCGMNEHNDDHIFIQDENSVEISSEESQE